MKSIISGYQRAKVARSDANYRVNASILHCHPERNAKRSQAHSRACPERLSEAEASNGDLLFPNLQLELVILSEAKDLLFWSITHQNLVLTVTFAGSSIFAEQFVAGSFLYLPSLT